jgi:outer membrane beta-barrel protein
MQHELDLGVGILPLDAFTKGLYAQVGYAFHFTDTFAWQVGRGAYAYSVQTGLRQQLERDFGVLPTVFDEIQFFVGSDLMWKPFYGKVAILNRWVVHGELHFILGATAFRFSKAFRPGVNLGLGARIYASKFVSLRIDLTDNIVIPTGGGTTGVLNVMTTTIGVAVNFGATE